MGDDALAAAMAAHPAPRLSRVGFGRLATRMAVAGPEQRPLDRWMDYSSFRWMWVFGARFSGIDVWFLLSLILFQFQFSLISMVFIFSFVSIIFSGSAAPFRFLWPSLPGFLVLSPLAL